MYLHWEHSMSARVTRRQFRWGRRRAAGNAANGGVSKPAFCEAEHRQQIFSAPGLTDRSGGGSSASHDAATDTGRKPAPAQTRFEITNDQVPNT